MPHIVFLTAYDEYAVQAFEEHAFDYLLKPAEPAAEQDAATPAAAQCAAGRDSAG